MKEYNDALRIIAPVWKKAGEHITIRMDEITKILGSDAKRILDENTLAHYNADELLSLAAKLERIRVLLQEVRKAGQIINTEGNQIFDELEAAQSAIDQEWNKIWATPEFVAMKKEMKTIS